MICKNEKEDFDHFIFSKQSNFSDRRNQMALEFFLQQFLTNPVPFAPMTKIHFELKEKIPTGEIDGYQRK